MTPDKSQNNFLIECIGYDAYTEVPFSNYRIVHGLRDFDEMKGSLVRFFPGSKALSTYNEKRVLPVDKFVTSHIGSTGMFLGPVHIVWYGYRRDLKQLELKVDVLLLFLVDAQILSLQVSSYTSSFRNRLLETRKQLWADALLALPPHSPWEEITKTIPPFDVNKFIEGDLRWWWYDGYRTSFLDNPNHSFTELLYQYGVYIELQRKSDGVWEEHRAYTP
jgi:hypothetical protein